MNSDIHIEYSSFFLLDEDSRGERIAPDPGGACAHPNDAGLLQGGPGALCFVVGPERGLVTVEATFDPTAPAQDETYEDIVEVSFSVSKARSASSVSTVAST
jgi:hypothetical protein